MLRTWRRHEPGVGLALAAAPGFGWLLLFFGGALGYGLLELGWRGYTHWSMLLAGGLCFCALNYLDIQLPDCGDWHKAWLGALIITTVELICGLLGNCWLGLAIWDYSRLPCNFYGQICLPFFLIWLGLARLLLYLVRFLRPLI